MFHDADHNRLIVSDAYYGIWEVDLKSGAKKQLISPDIEVQGANPRKVSLFNSVVLHSNGDIYFTSSSSEFGKPIQSIFFDRVLNAFHFQL